jgi:hypothetical protein
VRYVLLIYHGDPDHEPTPAQIASMAADYGAFTEGLHARKAYVDGSRLAPATSATTVRVRDGRNVITDGPPTRAVPRAPRPTAG